MKITKTRIKELIKESVAIVKDGGNVLLSVKEDTFEVKQPNRDQNFLNFGEEDLTDEILRYIKKELDITTLQTLFNDLIINKNLEYIKHKNIVENVRNKSKYEIIVLDEIAVEELFKDGHNKQVTKVDDGWEFVSTNELIIHFISLEHLKTRHSFGSVASSIKTMPDNSKGISYLNKIRAIENDCKEFIKYITELQVKEEEFLISHMEG